MADNKQTQTDDTSPGIIDSRHAMVAWNDQCTEARDELFEQIGLRRGLVIHEYGGVGRSSQNPVIWETKHLSSRKPTSTIESVTHYVSSEIARDLHTIGVPLTAIPFTRRWQTHDVEPAYQKEIDGNHEKAFLYLIGRYTINKITIQIEPIRMKPTPHFMDIITQAVIPESIKGYDNLIKVLNGFGYYVATQVTLGGVLLKHEETPIQQVEDARSERDAFATGFNDALHNIRSSEVTFRSFQQIGSRRNTVYHYNAWVSNLELPANWDIIYYDKLLPTLALIGMHNMAVGNACYNLLRRFSSYDEVKNLQAVIDMSRYANVAKTYFMNPI